MEQVTIEDLINTLLQQGKIDLYEFAQIILKKTKHDKANELTNIIKSKTITI